MLSVEKALGQSADPDLWGTDGNVSAIVRSGGTLYVGGSFNRAGPITGGGVPVDAQSGTIVGPYPRVTGTVLTVVADGSGGWFIGGSFIAVAGVPRSNLAHVLRGGRLADWAPNPDGEVNAIALGNAAAPLSFGQPSWTRQMVYVGGAFNKVGGKTRSHLAAVDPMTGAATAFDPGPNQPVRALLCDGTRLFVGGDFTQVGGQPHAFVAACDLAAGALSAWDPAVEYAGAPGSVRALAVHGDTLYLGGLFLSVGGSVRRHLAAVNATTGAVAGWNPNITGPNDDVFGDAFVATMAVWRSDLIIGGHFTGVGGSGLFTDASSTVRGGLARIQLSSGQATTWDPRPEPLGSDVLCLAASDSLLEVGGYFLTMGGQERDFVAQVGLRDALVTGWAPNATDAVTALAGAGGVIYVGGPFEGLGTQWRPRAGLAAFDVATGALKDWDPNPDGFGIESLALARGHLYVAGYFLSIGGVERDGLAAVDTLTGAATNWYPAVDNVVFTLAAAADTLYAGGAFTSIDGLTRLHLAAFDLSTGFLTGWDPGADDVVYDVEPSAGTLYLAGAFRSLGASPRSSLAAVLPGAGALIAWNPRADNWVSALAVAGDTVYAGGGFHTIGGEVRSNLAAIDRTTGLVLPWTADANSRVEALAWDSGTLYAGGSFTRIGGAERMGLAALNSVTGEVEPWDANLGARWHSAVQPVVWALTASSGTLYAGGMFRRAGTVASGSLAALPLASTPDGRPSPPSAIALGSVLPNPVRTHASIRFSLPSAAPVTLDVFDVRGRRIASLLDKAPRPAGPNEVPLAPTGWPSGFYFCRLLAGGHSVTNKFVVLR